MEFRDKYEQLRERTQQLFGPEGWLRTLLSRDVPEEPVAVISEPIAEVAEPSVPEVPQREGRDLLIVKRSLVKNEQDVFHATILEDILGQYDTSGYTIERRGVTIIDGNDARYIYRYLGRDEEQSVEQRYQEVIGYLPAPGSLPEAVLPKVRHCHTAGAVLLGDLKQRGEGSVFVALSLMARNNKRLNNERSSILEAIGIPGMPPPPSMKNMPHISLLKTHNVRAAQELKEELNSKILPGGLIKLGYPEMLPYTMHARSNGNQTVKVPTKPPELHEISLGETPVIS